MTTAARQKQFETIDDLVFRISNATDRRFHAVDQIAGKRTKWTLVAMKPLDERKPGKPTFDVLSRPLTTAVFIDRLETIATVAEIAARRLESFVD